MKTTKKPVLLGALSAAFVLSSVSLMSAPAAENWENHCAKCHGADGKGQTKVGKKLNLRDYTDAAVQAKMTDEEIIKAITDGITDDKGKEKMKAYKDELSADEIKDLLAHVRKFKG
ncbi:MAG: cytochrome c [Nibricoccus sp.]